MTVLPNSLYFGNLEISHIYEYYDGPRLFHAVNRAGANFIVFWIDTDEDSDCWLYSAITESRLALLNESKIKLRDIFAFPEDLVFKVKTYFDEDKISEIVGLSNDSLTEDLLPPADYYIEKSEAESNTVVHDSLPDVAELYIKNQKGKKQPSFSATGRISDAFANFYNSIRKKLDIKSSQYLSPIDARQGSFIIRLKSPNINECMPYIKNVFRILNESELPYQELTELGIDLKSVENLLAEVVDEKVKVQFSKEGLFEAELNITGERAAKVLAQLKDKSSSFVSSASVPQANDLEKVFRVVQLKQDFQPINPSDLDLTTDRQVAYYLHAARVLGFLSNSNTINSVGYQFSRLSKVDQMNIAAIRFESSDCGWAWLKWAGKSTLEELEPDSAQDFLLEMCPSLSSDTAIRRSKTLKKWQIELAIYRRSKQS